MSEHNTEWKARISKTSHDLRNALAIVYSHAQLLQLMLEKRQQESETAKELVTSIEEMQALLTKEMDGLKNTHPVK